MMMMFVGSPEEIWPPLQLTVLCSVMQYLVCLWSEV